MADGISVRTERRGDAAALSALITAAFAGRPYAEGDEADLLVALRKAGALTLSLVAEREGVLVGQAAFSPARPASGDEGWYGLGPVAVLPALERRGIGSRLIEAGLAALDAEGARGCIVVGDTAYYPRFGFRPRPGNAQPGIPRDHFMIRVFRGRPPAGPIAFHPAFGVGAAEAAEARVDGLFSRYGPGVAALGRALRAKLRARLPGLLEIVYLYERQDLLVISYSPTERGYEGVCTLSVYPDRVQLGFGQGARLSKADPGRLLRGSGKTVRHLVLETAEEFDRPEVQALIAAALGLAKVRLDPAAKGSLVLRADSQAARARRTAKPKPAKRRPAKARR